MLDNNKRLLAVLAHPDDETFGMGGTLAYYASKGVEVYLICATRGEAGEATTAQMQEYKTKGELREAELRCAAKALGIKNLFFLDYRDSGMQGTPDNQHSNALMAQPLEEVAAKIVHLIREIQPQVMITFDPVGGYHHPDHIAIHKASVMAFQAAGDDMLYVNGLPPFKPDKLFYHVFPRRYLRIVVVLMRIIGKDPTRFGKNHDINLAQLANDEDYPRHISIRYGKAADALYQATLCHASQLDLGERSPRLLSWLSTLSSRKDHFMQGYPEVPDSYHAKDLFSD